ncbi:MAG TPA: hypothetical protein VKV05_08615 [Terriglobales bacterium]|nr:hypothetical protein [Terriglobales bacterium]
MKLGIVGYGVIGKALARLFREKHELAIYDKYLSGVNSPGHKDDINNCELAFIAVPTPSASDGLSCDLSAVEEVVRWLRVPACLKSTVPPGTTDRLSHSARLPLGFSPEYVGEACGHPWPEMDSCGFVIVGGAKIVCDRVIAAYKQSSKLSLKYYCTQARTAELCKYMENCFLATKVSFVNQFFDIARYFDVDFEELRKLWLLDARVGSSHTVVRPERGFGGRCLPKDLRAIIAATQAFGGAPLLEAVLDFNDRITAEPQSGSNRKKEKVKLLA